MYLWERRWSMLSGVAQTRTSVTRSLKQLTDNLLLDDTNRARNALVVTAAREVERNPVFAARIIMTYRLLPARRRKAKKVVAEAPVTRAGE